VADSTLPHVTRARAIEVGLLAVVLVAQIILFTRPIHAATNYDEGVYLASVDALRHGQELGTDVFAPQMPGFYNLLTALSFVTGVGVAAIRGGLVAVMLLGTVGAWLIGRHWGGPAGGVLVAALLVVAPPLDLFGWQVIADTPSLALTALALGLATLAAPAALVSAGAALAAAVSIKLTAVTAVPAFAWFVRRRPGPAAAGAAVVALVLLVLHVSALGDLWASAVSYHQDARSTPALIEHPLRAMIDQVPRRTPFLWLALASLVVAAIRLALRRPLRTWPLWTWVALVVLFLLWHKPLHENHLVAFPFALAIAAGATLVAALPRHAAVYAGAALVLTAAYAQQLRRVDDARTPEPASNVAAARALERLVPSDARVVDDRPIISFRAHRRVVGELVDTAFLRFETGSLTDAKVIAGIRRADAVVVSRSLRTRPRVLAYVRTHFRRRYERGGVGIYVRP
jgi:hypothetical protein